MIKAKDLDEGNYLARLDYPGRLDLTTRLLENGASLVMDDKEALRNQTPGRKKT